MTRRKKRILICTSAIVGVALVWCVGVAIAVSSAGAPNPGATGDVAIVLGAAVLGDEPSPVFKARIDHAINLYQRKQVKRIIATGGLAEGDTLSEGEAARLYAIKHGVPGDAILAETESRSTKQNLANAKRIMKENELQTAVIVSDPHHLLRAGMHADRLGIQHVLSPTETSRYVGFSAKTQQLARETYYVTKLLLTGR